MTEREPIKVYELAKELGIDSISLVDKLKTLEINVKNHMSELSDTDVERARSVMKVGNVASKDKAAAKEKAPAKKAAASKPVTRRAAAKDDAEEKPAPAKEKAPAKKAAATKTAAAEPVKTKKRAPTQAETDAATSSSTSTVIRRRVLADGATQTVTSTISTETTELAAAAAAAEAASAKAASTVAPVIAETVEAPADIIEAAPAVETIIETAVVEAEPTILDVQVAATTTEDPLAKPPVATESVRTEVKNIGGKTTTSIIRRTQITSVSSGGAKSLLRVVEAAPVRPKPSLKTMSSPGTGAANSKATPTTPGGKLGIGTDRFKMVRVDKENLDRMAEEEARKRGPKAFEAVVKPEDVKFADYRKKETFFIAKKKKPPVGREVKQTEITVAAAHKRVVEMNETITVSDLAKQMQVKANDVIKKLMKLGTMATMNQALDLDTATLIAQEYEYEVKNVAFKEESLIETANESEESLQPRPPVVTIMGHVDHGKTTLLDSIREANVASGEAGGITQHIGAYTIQKDGKEITFIDTPGHEAFTSMRARGANVTDIVILVVSADDGVMPQTREAVSHAKAAGVPIIVAVNKIDKPGANPEKIKQGLSELDLLAEDWGGQTMFVPVSALKKTNLDKLLEAILLTAEVGDLKANPTAPVRGSILEARLEKGRGPVASVLVQRGTLRLGDIMVSGLTYGRVKAMTDHNGAAVKEVGPGRAAEVLGLESVPNAGELFDCVKDERAAQDLTGHRIEQKREKSAKSSKASLEELFARIKTGDMKELKIILKADVYGSVEAVRDSLVKLSNEKVKVKVILAAAGGITESDVQLANASDAIIIGFNVRPETKARNMAEQEKIEIKSYGIIYELLDEVKLAMAGLLDKKKVETYLGRAEVRQIFSVPKLGVIAGCSVVDGKIIRGAQLRLLRDSRVIYDGKMGSLKRFKDDAKEVAQGYECGIGFEGYNDLKIGDLIEAYQIDMVAQEL